MASAATTDGATVTHEGDILYRCLRPNESFINGLSPRHIPEQTNLTPSALSKLALGHVSNGSTRGFKSSFISFTQDVMVACKFAGLLGIVVATKCDYAITRFICNDGWARDVLGDENSTPVKLAVRSREALVYGKVQNVQEVNIAAKTHVFGLLRPSARMPLNVIDMQYNLNGEMPGANQRLFPVTVDGQFYQLKLSRPNTRYARMDSDEEMQERLFLEYISLQIYHLVLETDCEVGYYLTKIERQPHKGHTIPKCDVPCILIKTFSTDATATTPANIDEDLVNLLDAWLGNWNADKANRGVDPRYGRLDAARSLGITYEEDADKPDKQGVPWGSDVQELALDGFSLTAQALKSLEAKWGGIKDFFKRLQTDLAMFGEVGAQYRPWLEQAKSMLVERYHYLQAIPNSAVVPCIRQRQELLQPPPRDGHSAIVVQLEDSPERLYIFGGNVGDGKTTTADNNVWYLDLAKAADPRPHRRQAVWTFVSTNDGPKPVFSHQAVATPDKKGFIIHGGTSGSQAPDFSRDAWHFDAEEATWTLLPVGPVKMRLSKGKKKRRFLLNTRKNLTTQPNGLSKFTTIKALAVAALTPWVTKERRTTCTAMLAPTPEWRCRAVARLWGHPKSLCGQPD
eukprot:m.10432 g.10432  ORF g.10432 m.10432 type:complete len:627 (-) comp9636_c0_seq6:4104-5984(-)